MASKTSTTETAKDSYTEELKVAEQTTLTDAQRFTVWRDGTIVGSKRGDIFFGDAKSGTKYDGGEGDDTLLSSPGAVFFDGGSGSDTADYSGSKEGVTVDLANGRGESGDAKGDTYQSVENVVGTDQDDVLIGNDQNNRLEGGAGDDVFIPGDGPGQSDQIFGGEGFDTIDGSDYSQGIAVDMSQGTLNERWENGDEARRAEFESIEQVIGSDHDDVFANANFYTSFKGGAGNDTFIFDWESTFSFDGGEGVDTLDMSLVSHGYTVDFNTGQVSWLYGGQWTGDIANVEVIVGTDWGNAFVNGSSLQKVYGGTDRDTFFTNDLDFTLYRGGSLDEIDTISFANASGSIGTDADSLISVGGIASRVEQVEKIIGTEFDDEFGGTFHKQVGLGGNDTFTFNQALVDAKAPNGTLSSGDNLVEFDGGEGIDTVNVEGAMFGWLKMDGDSGYMLGQGVRMHDVENLNVTNSDLPIHGNQTDNTFILYNHTFGVANGETFIEAVNSYGDSSAEVFGEAGNDTVEMHYARNGGLTGPQSLEFDGGEGFDTLSYAGTNWSLMSPYDPTDPEANWASGLEFDVENGTVQERRVGDMGEIHTFQNVEAFQGSQIADRFVDGEGSQTYKGVAFAGDAVLTDEQAAALNQDTFVFSNAFSASGDVDTILDFAAGEDLLDLSATNRDSWAEILDGNWEQVGNDTVLDLGSGHDLVLKDVQFSSLTDADFIF